MGGMRRGVAQGGYPGVSVFFVGWFSMGSKSWLFFVFVCNQLIAGYVIVYEEWLCGYVLQLSRQPLLGGVIPSR